MTRAITEDDVISIWQTDREGAIAQAMDIWGVEDVEIAMTWRVQKLHPEPSTTFIRNQLHAGRNLYEVSRKESQ